MTLQEIITDLQSVFAAQFGIDGSVITRETTSKDVAGWDSVAHVMLITGIEKKFRIRFASREIAGFKSVGDLIDAVTEKTKSI